MTTPTIDPLRQTIIAVLYQLDHGEAGDLLGDGFDTDQAGYGDAVRDLTWCRNQLAEAIGLPEGTTIELDAGAARTPAIPIADVCDGCRDAVPAWFVRERGELSQVCNDCYSTHYQNSDRAGAWEADPIPPADPAPISAERAAMAEAARLARTLRFLAGDVETYIAEMAQRQMTHVAGNRIAALKQTLGLAQSVLRESNRHQPVLADVALWKDGYHELARASGLLLRTVHDTLRHGLTLTARANLDDVCRQLAPLLSKQAREGAPDA